MNGFVLGVKFEYKIFHLKLLQFYLLSKWYIKLPTQMSRFVAVLNYVDTIVMLLLYFCEQCQMLSNAFQYINRFAA